ncbi:hypothetical protein [Streptomyces sp. NRRL S-646]|nr:hypothetical protein [Streptomyces sp. NRRL S-646]
MPLVTTGELAPRAAAEHSAVAGACGLVPDRRSHLARSVILAP